MTPKQTAWALLATCCRQQVVCERCEGLGMAIGSVAFREAAESLLENTDLSWPLAAMTKLLGGIVRNDDAVIGRFPEEMRQDVALLIWRIPLERRRGPFESVMEDFRPLAEEAGVDMKSLESLIGHVWVSRVQRDVNARQAERRRAHGTTLCCPSIAAEPA